MLFERLKGDNNRTTTNVEKYSTVFNNVFYVGTFYSITKKEFETVYNMRLDSVNRGRQYFVVLNHLHQYSRTIKGDIFKLYNLNDKTTTHNINTLLRLGLIRGYTVKRKSNLVYYVDRTGYSITNEGVAALTQINELITAKINKMTKKQIKGF